MVFPAEPCSPSAWGTAPGLLPVLRPIAAQPHQQGWGGKAPSLLAEPCSRQSQPWDGSDTRCSPSVHPRWGRQGPPQQPLGARSTQGNPSPGPQPVGAGTSSPALPSPSPPPWLAGRRVASWQSRPLAGTGLAGGSQPGARSGRRELTRFLPPQAAPGDGQIKHGRCRCRNAGQGTGRQAGLQPGTGSKGSRTGSGDGSRTEPVPPPQQGANTHVPTRPIPQELRPLLSLPFPFILCICT